MAREEFEAANRRGRETLAKYPHAVAARYDNKTKRIVVALSSGLDISFHPGFVQGLEDASALQLQTIEISPSGLGIHFPKVDADIYIPGLLEGVFGSKQWMASRLGAEGGKSRSAAKTLAARSNGRLGGRPRKGASHAEAPLLKKTALHNLS